VNMSNIGSNVSKTASAVPDDIPTSDVRHEHQKLVESVAEAPTKTGSGADAKGKMSGKSPEEIKAAYAKYMLEAAEKKDAQNSSTCRAQED